MKDTTTPKKGGDIVLDEKALANALDLLTNIQRFPEFCKTCLKIIPIEGGKLIPFVFNKIQMWFFLNYIMKPWMEGVPIRVILLKCRQTGMSTLISAFAMWCTLGNKHWNSCLIAKNDEQVKIVFEMVHRFKEHLPSGTLLPYFPTTRDSIEIVEFNQPNIWQFKKRLRKMRPLVYLDSRFRILSGEKKGELGRAGTFQTVHGSEAAFWKDLRNSLSALMATCHYQPKTSIFLETTAQGYNEFYQLWMNRKVAKKNVPTYWVNVFIPWYWDQKYELYDWDYKFERKFEDDYERELFNRILTDETIDKCHEEQAWAKIFWRRMEIDSRGGDQEAEDKFAEDYPATDSEAFISTGRPVWSKAAIKKAEMQVREPKWRGHIKLSEPEDKNLLNVKGAAALVPKLKEVNMGPLRIWEHPKDDEYYIVSGDIAEGRAADGLSEDKERYDYTCCYVTKCTPYPPAEQVAAWHGTIDPDLFGEIMVALCKYYNNAFLGWEVNSAGRGLIYHVRERYKYPFVYMRPNIDHGGHTQGKLTGWFTSRSTKPMLVLVGKEMHREGNTIVRDSGFVSEMKAFSVVGDGQFKALTGHDDRIMAWLIGLYIGQPRYKIWERRKAKKKEKRRQRDLAKNPYYKKKDKDFSHPDFGNEF
jgi:hypothetical protein